MDWIVAIVVAIAAAALGAAGGYQYRKQAGEKKIGRTTINAVFGRKTR